MPIPHERTPGGRWPSLALVLLTLGVAAWRAAVLAREDLWFDEVFSVVLASQGIGELVTRALDDRTNPPGFYAALWAWARLGSFDTAWLRALPALAAVATVPAVAWLATGLRLPRETALLAATLAAVGPLLLAMGGEVRAYAPLALFTCLALGLGARIALSSAPPRRTALVALAACHIVLVGLHYFGLLVVLATISGTAITSRTRTRAAVVAALPALAALAAWGLAVILRSGAGTIDANVAWIRPATGGALTSFASQVVGTFATSWGAWLVLIAIAAALLRSARGSRRSGDPKDRWLLAAVWTPLAIVPAVGLATGQPIWVARYLIILLPPLWILLADSAARLEGPARTAAITLLVGWACAAGTLAELARPSRPPWSLVVRAVAGAGPVTACVNESYVGLPLRYHALVERLPLEVQELDRCATARNATLVLIRPGTESSLERIERAGAVLGPPRSLGTRLPEVDRRRILGWEPR